MRFNAICFILILLFSCTDKLDFDIQERKLDVIDGVISTNEGDSYILIYELIDDSTQFDILNLSVNIRSDKGETFPFYYDSGRYIPQDPNFTGKIGTSYRMVASGNNGLIYESEFDQTPAAISVEMFTKDTTRLRLTTLNIIEEVESVAAVAKIAIPNADSIQARLFFEYSYLNPLTEKREVTTFKNQFVLFNCLDKACLQGDTATVPVGITSQINWRFLNPTIPDCLNHEGNVDLSNGCLPPCCRFEDNWNAEFKLTSESMSQTAFEYWEDVRRLINNDGLIFDTFPFPIEGNVSCVECENRVVGLVRSVTVTSSTENRVL